MAENKKKIDELIPADVFTLKQTEDEKDDDSDFTEDEFFGNDPEAMGYEEIDSEELAAMQGDHSVIDEQLIYRLRNTPAINEERYHRLKKHLEAGHIDFQKINSVQTLIDLLETWQRMINESDVYNKIVLGNKTYKKPPEVDISILLKSLNDVLDIISNEGTNPSRKLKSEISNTIDILSILCKKVFDNYEEYTPEDIILIVDWLNNISSFPEYMAIFKDMYINFVVTHVNNLLKEDNYIDNVYVKALGIIININSRVISVILKEKSEDYAQLVRYVKKLKTDNKI